MRWIRDRKSSGRTIAVVAACAAAGAAAGTIGSALSAPEYRQHHKRVLASPLRPNPAARDGKNSARPHRRQSATLHKASTGAAKVFATHPHPVALAFNGDRLLAVGGDQNDRECSNTVTSYDTSGNASIFAVIPNRPGCVGSLMEDAMVSVPQGLTGWRAGDTYVAHGGLIVKIDSSGIVSNFATGPCPDNSAPSGATFDTFGSWGRRLLITCNPAGTDTGPSALYGVSPDGSVRMFGRIPAFVEGIAVAPSTFSPLSGHLILAGENDDALYSINPGTGKFSFLMHVNGEPEDVSFVPRNVCEWSSGGAFYTAVAGLAQISARPASEFAGMAGKLVITTENGTGLFVMGSPTATPVALDTDTRATLENSTFITYSTSCR